MHEKKLLKNLNFDTWLKHHAQDHYAKWCRELYPYSIFNLIDFSHETLNTKQRLWHNLVIYYAEITSIELQENGRWCAEFSLSYSSPSKSVKWNNRLWSENFKIIFTNELDFITVFTSKEDPSKTFVANFMKGKFVYIEQNKSKPLSDLLVRTLLSYMCKENFNNGVQAVTYQILTPAYRQLPKHQEIDNRYNNYTPIYSQGRELWIIYSFSEERANREAIAIANQCKKLISVYIKPTYTRHHRCKFENTAVVSAFSFLASLDSRLQNRFIKHIQFLQNHLNIPESIDVGDLRARIQSSSTDEVEILKPHLIEAFSIMKVPPRNASDIFYKLSGFNLINAWASRHKRKTLKEREEDHLFANIYYFKDYLSNFLADLIEHWKADVDIYINKDLFMIEIEGFQFSFHNVPKNKTIETFEGSADNVEIVWRGKRLQPIATLIFQLAKSMNEAT